MLVHDRSERHGWGGRRSRSGERSWPRSQRRHEHLRRWWSVAERGVRTRGVGVPPPALDNNLRLPQAVQDLAIQKLVPELTSVTPIERIASATL
jgi:hypothetical protein